MRRFLVLGHLAPVRPDFHLNDLPGGAGRIDVLCRAMGAALLLSHGIRSDVEAILLLRDSVRIRIAGDRVKRLNPDERSTAALIRRALRVFSEASVVSDPGVASDAAGSEVSGEARHKETQSTPGIFVSRCTLSGILDEWLERGDSPIVLHEDGVDAETYVFPSRPAFILSDHTDFTAEEERLLSDFPRVSLGPTSLHTSQAITIVHYLLDRQSGDLEEDLVLAHKVWSEPKAQLITGLLEDFEIPANLVSHATPSVYPMAVDGLAEVRIMVRSRDLRRARQIIADYFEPPCEE
jgi:tRNA (pseudouridine54-N1)-methyltransferase